MVWQINPAEDTARRWWQPEADDQNAYALAGITYDADSGQILVTNATANTIHALSVAEDDPQATTLYTYTGNTQAPGFNGISTGTDGDIYRGGARYEPRGTPQPGQRRPDLSRGCVPGVAAMWL